MLLENLWETNAWLVNLSLPVCPYEHSYVKTGWNHWRHKNSSWIMSGWTNLSIHSIKIELISMWSDNDIIYHNNSMNKNKKKLKIESGFNFSLR